MKLRVPFHYTISYVPHQCFKDRREWGAGETEVEIREIKGGDAPVAFRVGNHKGFGSYGDNDRMFDRKPDGGLREVRIHEGKLYVEAEEAEGLQGRVDGNLAGTVFGPCNARAPNASDPKYAPKIMTLRDIQFRERYPLKSFADDGGASVAERLARRAGQILLVDGKSIFQRCPEPVLKIDTIYGRAYVSPRPRPAHVGYDQFDVFGDSSSALYERLSDAGLLLASPLATDEGKPVEVRCDWEVVDPRFSVFDGTAYDVSRLASETLRMLSSNAIGLPRDALEAMYVLRDAIEDASGRATPRLVAALRDVAALTRDADNPDRLARVAAACARRRGSTLHWGHDRSVGEMRAKAHEENHVGQAAESALRTVQRWEARPGGGWEDTAGPVSSHRKGRMWCRELLSPGQIIDACQAAGVDPAPLLAAAQAGRRIYQVAEGGHMGAHSIGTMDRDGTVVPVGERIQPDMTMAMIYGVAEAAEKTVETAFDMIPMR